MSTIILPHRWTTQPQYPVEIDWGNPLARGLVHAISFGNDDLVSKQAFSFPNGVTKKPVQAGIGNSFVSGSSQYATLNTSILTGAPITLFALHRPESATGAQAVISTGTASSTNRLVIFFNSTANAYSVSGSGGATAASSTVSQFSINPVCTTYDGTTASLYLGGVFQTSTNTLIGTQPTTRILLNARVNSTVGVFGTATIPLSLFYNRVLSDKEVSELSRNPWQIFRPITKRIYVGASSANTYTLTSEQGAFTETGNAATLAYNRAIAASKGTFTLAGQDVTFPRSRIFTADKGTFNLTGSAASFQYGSTYALTAESVSFALTGNSATFPRSRVFAVDSGSIVLTGNDAILNYSGAADYTLSCATGDFSLTGIQIAASKTVQAGKRLKFWTGTEWKA